MKRFISMLMAVAMIAAVMLAFPAPASATDYYIQVTQPYYEDYFGTNDAGTYAEVSFSVPITGDYIIQTFGFYDEDGSQVEVYAEAELYLGSELIDYCPSSTGYGWQNLFMQVDLNANYLYTLCIWFSESVYFGRISFTNASEFCNPVSPGINEYFDIYSIPLSGSPGTITSELEFSNQNSSRAMVFQLSYEAHPDNYALHVEISAHCCACTHVALVVPYGHALDGEQVVFDACQTSIEYWLSPDVDYYLVVYLGLGDLPCTDHSAYPIVEITIEVF